MKIIKIDDNYSLTLNFKSIILMFFILCFLTGSIAGILSIIWFDVLFGVKILISNLIFLAPIYFIFDKFFISYNK